MNQTPGFSLGPNETQPAYEYVGWPAWRYHPETGEGKIFESADQVPLDWTDIPPGTTPPGEEPIQAVEPPATDGDGDNGDNGDGDNGDNGDGDNGDGANGDGDNGDGDNGDGDDSKDEGTPLTKEELVALGQNKLAAILADKNAARKAKGADEIEYLPNWPKVKLADTIIDNGGYVAPKEA